MRTQPRAMTSDATTRRSPQRLPRRADGAVTGAENDEDNAGSRAQEGEPALEVEALVGKKGSAGGEDDGHGADHERGVADSGEFQPFKLDR
jgi:hypothetical protein